MTTPTQPDGVITIDHVHLGRNHVIATYLLLGDAPAVVDPGPASTLPTLEAGLAAHGLGLADLRAVVLTHIHLDHAGATGVILARNPHLHVYVHERGAPHLLDPSRLINSASQLYGSEMERLWGEILPVAPNTVVTLGGGETIQLGSRTLHAYDSPGHARHHLVYFDEQSGGAFVGDNCGVRLPGVSFCRPATPPPEVDLEAWDRTIDMIAGLDPRWLMLTHFGAFSDVAHHLEDFRTRLHRWAEWVRVGLASGASDAEQLAAFNASAAAEAKVLPAAEQEALTQQSGALDSSWRGLARYWQKKAAVAR